MSPQTPRGPTIKSLPVRGGPTDQQKLTVKLVGRAIIEGSRYYPIRHRAARLAARAAPKDYLGQVREIYNDFLKRWRYVKDPIGRELVTAGPKALFETVMGGDGQGRGAGDCDCASGAMGAQIASIGIPVKLATTAPVGAPAGPLSSHIFPQANIPGHGWVTVDPVVYPEHGFGYTPPHSRLITWDLTGGLLSQSGNSRGLRGCEDLKGVNTMLGEYDVDRFVDYGGLGDCAPSHGTLPDFRVYGIKDYGAYTDQLGMLPGMGFAAEVDEVDEDDHGRAWTPMLEFAPHDYAYLSKRKKPYDGMGAVGDNGEFYEYDGSLGFFRKLFKRVKKGIKKGLRRAKRFAKKLLRKIPGGKYLLKLGKKVWKVAKKLVKPLMKLVGPLAKKLAPIAALIPGYGPAIAAGLQTVGKVAGLMKKYGAKLATPKDGGISRLKFPSGNAAKAFQSALKRSAERLAREQKSAKGRRRSSIRRGVTPKARRGRRMVARRMPRKRIYRRPAGGRTARRF